jgi:signal transduction histidine kinase/uncharacterized protein YpmB
MMLNSDILLYLLGLWGFITIIILVIVIILKSRHIQQMQVLVKQLKKSLDEMDEQTKLIIRTDMELNKTQEELDRKITGLYALQRLSRNLSTTLQEEEMFKRIGTGQLQELGMERALVFLWEEKEKKFLLQLNIGYEPEEIEAIISKVNSKTYQQIFLGLIRQKNIFSSNKGNSNLNQNLCSLFGMGALVVCPILPKTGACGFICTGVIGQRNNINEGDEESIAILANQIGQALENARLFEATWHAQQELEKKVETRTAELSQALEEVKKVNNRKSEFVSAVSHELRTPLTSIKGYASILLSEKLGPIPEAARQRLERINRHSDELAHLVTNLLDISRIESGRVIMKQRPCNLTEIINTVLELLSVQLKEKQIKTDIHIPQATLNILADQEQIQRVFINLIGNAIKFTPKGGNITILAHPQDNLVRIEVKDTGCGIPADSLDKIFDEFYRVDSTINQRVKGTGLGLSLVKNIIEAHGGKIWARSKQGQGTTFSFTLPKA